MKFPTLGRKTARPTESDVVSTRANIPLDISRPTPVPMSQLAGLADDQTSVCGSNKTSEKLRCLLKAKSFHNLIKTSGKEHGIPLHPPPPPLPPPLLNRSPKPSRPPRDDQLLDPEFLGEVGRVSGLTKSAVSNGKKKSRENKSENALTHGDKDDVILDIDAELAKSPRGQSSNSAAKMNRIEQHLEASSDYSDQEDDPKAGRRKMSRNSTLMGEIFEHFNVENPGSSRSPVGHKMKQDEPPPLPDFRFPSGPAGVEEYLDLVRPKEPVKLERDSGRTKKAGNPGTTGKGRRYKSSKADNCTGHTDGSLDGKKLRSAGPNIQDVAAELSALPIETQQTPPNIGHWQGPGRAGSGGVQGMAKATDATATYPFDSNTSYDPHPVSLSGPVTPISGANWNKDSGYISRYPDGLEYPAEMGSAVQENPLPSFDTAKHGYDAGQFGVGIEKNQRKDVGKGGASRDGTTDGVADGQKTPSRYRAAKFRTGGKVSELAKRWESMETLRK